jgi:hypothetical protein
MAATMTDEQIEKCWPTAFVMPATQRVKLLAFARAVLAADQVPQWLPIESAPKDGTMILVNDTTPGWTPWVAASWLEGDEWQGWVYDDAASSDNNPMGPQPTHYIHLPATPASSTSPMGEGEAV